MRSIISFYIIQYKKNACMIVDELYIQVKLIIQCEQKNHLRQDIQSRLVKFSCLILEVNILLLVHTITYANDILND